jgi:hypothetical protein
LLNDPKLSAAMRAAIQPANLRFSSKTRTLGCNINVNGVPANVAFEVLVRFAGHEKSIGSLHCQASSGTTSFGLNGQLDQEPPGSVDLILRSSQAVARQSVDLTQIWSGELVYPNQPVTVMKDGS